MKCLLRSVVAFMVITGLTGCATFMGFSRKPVYPTKLTSQMQDEFSAAEKVYLSKNFGEAKKLYLAYVSAYGYNEFTDEARFKSGEMAFSQGKYDAALSHYREASQDLYNPAITPKAQFKAALSLYYLRRPGEAMAILDKMERRDESHILALRTDSLAVDIGKKLGQTRDQMIKWYLFLLDDYAVLSPQDYEGKITEKLVDKDTVSKIVLDWAKDANVSRESVEALPISAMKGKPSGGYVYYKLAMSSYARGDFNEASRFMKSFLRGYPRHELVADASSLLDGLKGKVSGKQFRVGVILPLSGRFEMYGSSTLHGIQCAAGLTPPCTSPFNVELVVKDTGGDPALTEKAVEELAKENVIAIIGPLLSATVSGAASKAQSLRIPLISLSQREGVSEGGYVFRHALTPEDQVETLVDYSVNKKGVKKFGILYPFNKYGSYFAQLFRSSVAGAGGKVVYERGYTYQDLSAAKAVGDMGEGTSVEGGVVEGMRQSFNVPPSVQALFIPDSYKAVRYVVSAVQNDSKNLSPGFLFMGVNRWNNPGLVSHDMGLLEGSIFVDGFYKGSADVTTRHFVQSFLNAFGTEPTILEAQAYDALRLIMTGIKDGGGTREKLTAALGRIRNMSGVTGNISIDSKGDTRRRLFILTVRNGVIAELSSARGIIKDVDFSYSRLSKQQSDAKYDGVQPPDLTVRTNREKYEPNDFYTTDMEKD